MFLINLLAVVAPVTTLIAVVRAEMSRREVRTLSARVLELRTRLRAVEAAEDARKLSAMVERNRHPGGGPQGDPLTA